jgi:hypothetical protein
MLKPRYPDRKELNVGSLQLHAGGLRNRNSEGSVSIYGSGLLLNDTSSNSHGATIAVASAAGWTEMSKGKPLVVLGQEAGGDGGDVVIKGGEGGESGGDLVLDGGKGDTGGSGLVRIGEKSEKVSIASNKTEVSASGELLLKAGIVSVKAPVVFEDSLVMFSTAAIEKGATFNIQAVMENENGTIRVDRSGHDGDLRRRFWDASGIVSSAFTTPADGGMWSVQGERANK